MLTRIKFDLDDLAEEMLDTLPEELFQNKTTTFLDPAMGGGQFVAAIERRLRKYGHSDSNIADRVFGLEKSWRAKIAVNKMKLLGEYGYNYEVADFLEAEMAMKFDCYISNPPYQSTEDGSKRKKPWVEFASKAIDSGAYVAFVTPEAWQSRNSKYFTDISKKIKKHLTHYANANDYFDVGEKIGYWIIDPNVKKPVEVISNNPYEPIYNKMLRKGDKWHYRDHQQPYSDITKERFPSSPQKQFNVPIYWTAKQTRWAQPEDLKYNGWKVIINNSGHYYLESNPDKYSFVTNEMSVGLGAWGIKVDSEEEGHRVLSWVRSKLYRAIVQNMKTGGFNNPFIELECLGVDKHWTDEEIYDHFNLSIKERKLIDES